MRSFASQPRLRLRLRRQKLRLALAACFAFAAPHLNWPSARLDAADPVSLLRSEVRDGGSSAESAGSGSAASSMDDQRQAAYRSNASSLADEGGDQYEVIGQLAILGLAAPFAGPYMLLGDDLQQRAKFPSYPYQVNDGSLVLGSFEDLPPGIVPGRWMIRGGSDFGSNFSGTSYVGAQILVDTTPRLGFDADYRWINESRSPLPDDSLNLGDANLLVRFAQSERAQFRAGAGFNWLSDREGSDFGFNFTYGVDIYPMQPVVLSTVLDLGTLGDATLFHLRSTAGVSWNRAEGYVGYDYLHVEQFDLHSLVAGLRLSF